MTFLVSLGKIIFFPQKLVLGGWCKSIAIGGHLSFHVGELALEESITEEKKK